MCSQLPHLITLLLLLLAANLLLAAPAHTMAARTASGGLTVIDANRLRTTTTSSSLAGSSSSLSLSASSLSSSPRSKRHRKRNSNWIDYRNFNESTTALEWVNPCGGAYHATVGDHRYNRLRPRQSFNQLKRHAFREYRGLNSSQDSVIDIRNMTMWSLHTQNYKFLPKLKPNSTIALKRWYRNMQTYVASFAYLRRLQIRWDQRFITRESTTARELRELLLSSRRILCELETAVNQTSPRRKHRRSGAAALNGSAASMGVQLPQISRNEMNKRLKLRSKGGTGGPGAVPGPLADGRLANEADSIDMRFVKHHYYEFVRTMWQLLRRDGKRERKRNHRPTPHQQRQQQQQQQSIELPANRSYSRSSTSSSNSRDFNEVSKPESKSTGGTSSNVGGSASASSRRGKRQSTAAGRQQRQRRVQRT